MFFPVGRGETEPEAEQPNVLGTVICPADVIVTLTVCGAVVPLKACPLNTPANAVKDAG